MNTSDIRGGDRPQNREEEALREAIIVGGKDNATDTPTTATDGDRHDDPSSAPDRGDMEPAERHARRRVRGLSAELTAATEVENRALRLERLVRIGVWNRGTQEEADNSLTELAALSETAGALVLEGLTQRRTKPDPATYIGKGKAAELRDIVAATGAEIGIASCRDSAPA